MQTLARLFTDHPAEVDETYVEHLGVAFGFATLLLLAGLAALVHALIPGLCKHTASGIIKKLHARVSGRS